MSPTPGIPPGAPKNYEQVTQAIDDAIFKNRYKEWVTIWSLMLLLLVGMSLTIAGVFLERLSVGIPGGITNLGIVWPIKHLLKLRADNVRLLAIPSLLILTGPQRGEELA